jgi:hypothetical protein
MRHVLAAAIIAVSATAVAYAHEGHDHRIAGTVSSIHEMQLELKSPDGKTSAIVLNGDTKVIRGTDVVTVAAITPGTRAVVTTRQTKGAGGAMILLAKEVRLGPSPTPSK